MKQKLFSPYHLGLLFSFLAVFIWSAIGPLNRFIWFLEVFPAIISVVLLLVTYKRFTLTNLTYTLIWAHTIILLVGGHYTYAEVPLFTWLSETWDLGRNHFDRIGHFAQGFIPAIIAREILIRTSPLKNSRWLAPLVVAVCLAISALYELFEFIMALATGTAAEPFLGTQGDVWDTQWDMLLAFLGAILSLFLLHATHDRQLKRLK